MTGCPVDEASATSEVSRSRPQPTGVDRYCFSPKLTPLRHMCSSSLVPCLTSGSSGGYTGMRY
jgi:hypothetical protein